ncbi:MAG: hypothetical protein PHE25_03600 [Candidatus Gracilibacteria bacterium]|nr:hypothetical protein [Candidatus Gracilibacteria bacterium]
MEKLKSFIPEEIINEVSNRGFYLYRWIKYTDLINILKNELIIVISKFGKYIFIILLILSIIIIPTLVNIFYLLYFLGFFILIGIFILLYLTVIGIKHSYYIIKNSFIIITNSSIVINGKIISISNFKEIEKELLEVEKIFQKKLFLDNKQIFSYKNLVNEFKKGFEKIYVKKIGGIVFLLLIMYLIHIIIMSFIYFIGTILIVFISLILGIINKFILKNLGHKVININSLFINIENSSNKIIKNKININKLLLNIKDKIYETGLINSINLEITKFNKNIEHSINLNIKLKNEIKNSKYIDIYDFNIYNLWIKKELIIPLNEFKIILELSLTEIKKQLKIIDDLKIQEKELNKSLELQKMSLDLFGDNIYDKIQKINYYLNLLKNGQCC